MKTHSADSPLGQSLATCTCLWSNTFAGASSIESRDPNCPMHGRKDTK